MTLSAAWAPPREPSRARLVLPVADAELDVLIRGSAWANVARHTMSEYLGFFEAVGASSLAFAAALVASQVSACA